MSSFPFLVCCAVVICCGVSAHAGVLFSLHGRPRGTGRYSGQDVEVWLPAALPRQAPGGAQGVPKETTAGLTLRLSNPRSRTCFFKERGDGRHACP